MAAGIGQLLRDTRTKRGIELDEVERVTKIRVKLLQALEEERWDDLPAPVYVRGFLATYARFLDLDDRALVDEYRRAFEPMGRPEPIPPGLIRPGKRRGRRPIVPAAMLVAGLACIAALVLGLVALVGSLSGSDDDGDPADQREGRAAGTTTEPTTERAGEVSVELHSTGAVWVCLVDDRDRALIDGETLPANDARGPFDGRAFDVTFGNGSVEMTVDGVPADIPPVAEPVGYRVSAGGVRELEPSEQPSCL
jgi:cytoskeleton protein RodZ